MRYIDGFVIAVETARKQEFLDHAKAIDPLFLEFGASRVVECWGEDVTVGKVTDFRRAVQAQEGETVVFSWIEWPDKPTRDAGSARMETDERMAGPMPFDGKRMIFGGFEPIVEQGTRSASDYVQGFVLPVPRARREDYRKMADEAWAMFKGYGATSVVEAWGDDVPAGKQTDFYRAVAAEPGENAVISWMTWPSREACDAAAKQMEADGSMKMPDDMPFDPRRMIYAGFAPVFDLPILDQGA